MQAGRRALRVHAGLLDRIARHEPRRPSQRIEGCFHEPGRVAHRPKVDPHSGTLAGSETAQASSRHESAFVESGRFDVRSDRLRTITGQPAVVPRLVVALGLEEMEGESGDLFLDGDARCRLDRLGHAAVQLAAAAEREAFVRSVTYQRVAEPHAPCEIGVDEAAKPRPERIVELRLVPQRHRQLPRIEARAEHGGVPQHRPIGG